MNIKFSYTLISAVVIVIGFSGCSKNFLNTKIDTYETPATIATDRATLFDFANAMYVDIPNGFSALDNNFFAAASDDGQQTAKYATNALLFNQGGLNSNSINIAAGEGFYKNMYDGIRACNFFLNYSKNASTLLALNRDTVSDSVNYHRDELYTGWYRAEAHVLRAFYYAQLIKRYGGVPLITGTLENTDSLYVQRATYDQVVNFIVSEIDEYADSLQTDWATSIYSDQEGRFTKGAALALESRVLLFAASPLHNPGNDITKWQAAAAAAYAVIQLNQYSLDPNYGNYFTGNNALTSPETIFAVRMPASNSPEKANYPIATPGGNSGVCPTQNLVSAYEYIGTPDPSNPYANRDPRLAATVVVNGGNWNGRTMNEAPGGTDDMTLPNTSRTGYYLRKFLTDNLNLAQGGTASHTWVVFRYAEILLNYAEAMNEAYGPDNNNGYSLTASQALEMVRNRASTALPQVTAQSREAFRQAVQHERRVELAFEDFRYWDLLRWNEADSVLNQPVQG
ncbi:MAG: RagB/SusD family nutrient uptake outer membrane protein, partial [Chitinophagaceae bacterium]